jgi:hypothetical protein
MRFSILVLVALFAVSARAAVSGGGMPRCYAISVSETPEASPWDMVRQHEADEQRWCYWDQAQGTLVFNADEPTIRPELAALVEWTADHRIGTITHGSLLKGVRSIHRSQVTAVDPLPVTLDERALGGASLRSRIGLTDGQMVQAYAIASQFRQSRAAAFRATVTEGTFTAMLDDSKLPYKGYWWPFATVDLAAGAHSPLGKYDAIVGKWTGTNPGSAAWESANHSTTAVAWGGHCNGWAASSVLYPDFTKYLWDKDSQQVLFPSDIKGILTEASFCVSFNFYGHRYNGNPGDDLLDIYPDLFHQTLVYYLSEVKKPIAFDYERDVPVDNNVITGYTMTITKTGVPNQFHVVAALRVHNYQPHRDEASGSATLRNRQYEYLLNTDANGNIVSGTWISDNPDFLWVPLAPKQNCSGKNPKLDLAQIDKLMTTLPEAKTSTLALGFSVDEQLIGHQSLEVKIPAQKGSMYKLAIRDNNFTDGTLEVVAQGLPVYPVVDPNQGNPVPVIPITRHFDEPGEILYAGYIDPGATSEFDIPLTNVSSLMLVNDSDNYSSGNKLVIDHIDFLSGN